MFVSGKGTLSSAVIQFSYVELEQASSGFSKDNLIGIGGSSNVYRGELKDGRTVAIKKLRPVGGSEMDPEFLHEVLFEYLLYVSQYLFSCGLWVSNLIISLMVYMH